MYNLFIVSTAIAILGLVDTSDGYTLDDSPGLGRRFDGIGGLSGGGATSRLLVSYPDEQRNEVLDYLFKPNFGAALQILKVEIGGDGQSTDGTESSHMHSQNDESYERGYEWWLMQEAKKRNPEIKLSGLSWAYPAWVGNGSGSPYKYPNITANYILKWLQGAKTHYNLTIDYIGIWNERAYDSTYVKTLRSVLDQNDLSTVKIVAADTAFAKIASDVQNDPELKKSVSVLGAHYPGTHSTSEAQKTGLPLWASEDYSTYNNDVGAGCWARILNRNYVNGYMTSTISWNLCASYYQGLPFFRDGLMTAIEPWSGHYDTNGPIWVSAHTTQFTRPGMYYLKHGSGVGHLEHGGSYVTFYDTVTQDFTIVIETMASAKSLNLWVSDVKNGVYFQQMKPLTVTSGQFNVTLDKDHVYTLSTSTGQTHGQYPDVPQSQLFPVPYSDDFESYALKSEASLFADQSGVFEISSSDNNQYMTQVVPERPITWCDDSDHPVTIIGNISWYEVTTEVMIRLEQDSTQAFLAAGIAITGCDINKATGIYVAISNSTGDVGIYQDLALTESLKEVPVTVETNMWYKVMLKISSGLVSVQMNNTQLTAQLPSEYKGGFIGFGTGGFYPAHFDNFKISEASPH